MYIYIYMLSLCGHSSRWAKFPTGSRWQRIKMWIEFRPHFGAAADSGDPPPGPQANPR